MTSHGFPNWFYTGFSQGAVSANTTSMYEQQAEHIAFIIKETLARGAASVETSREAQDEWGRIVRETAVSDGGYAEACTPGYYNNEGGGGGEGIRSSLGEPYGPGFYAFDQLLQEWRDKGDLAGLVLGT
jgi:cyclohexanone monooxygenase